MGSFAETFRVFAVFLGTIIGAGFASGREVYVYFARFGGWGLIATIIAGILFFGLGLMFLKLGRRVQADNMYDFLRITFGRFTKVVEIVIAFSYVIVIGAMFAGFDSIQKILFPTTSFPILQILSVVLTILVAFGGIKNITKINFILLPSVVLFICVIFISSIINKEQSIAFIVFDNSILSLIGPLVSCLIFVCSNMFLTGFILMKTGANSVDIVDKRASIMTGTTIFLIIFFSCFSLALNPSAINFDMPFLMLSFKVGDAFVYFSVLVLWFAIFTSAVASLYTLSWWLNSYIERPKTSVMICAVFAFILSKVGFNAIIDVLYPLTGFMDIAFVMSSAYLYYKSNKTKKKGYQSYLKKFESGIE